MVRPASDDRAPSPPSLQQKIGRHVLLSLLGIWCLGCAVFLGVADHFVAEAFDRALLDDAHALAAHVRTDTRGEPALDLTAGEADLLRFDHAEQVLFAVFNAQGRCIAGDCGLPADTVPPQATHIFSDLQLDAKALRRVSLHLEEHPAFSVSVAQTTNSRTQLMRRLLAYSGLVQLWLLVVLGSWLLRRIERDLRPLSELQEAVAHRSTADLRPLSLRESADTRDVQRLVDALDSLLARMQRSVAAQREFAGTVAHELRTPLAGIRAQAAHALAQNDPVVWRSELEGIAQAELRASRTVDQLLALARAIEGGIALDVQSIALDELVHDLVVRNLPRTDAAGVDLGAEGLDEPLRVRGHAGLIEGILNNLLDNAMRYGQGAEPRITVALRKDAPFAVLSVVDNGPGIEGLSAGRVMERWAQGEPGQRQGVGMGLGLSIVSSYAELMGGRFELMPADGKSGLCASVWLPLDGAR